MTVYDLLEACQKQIKKGNGNKTILVADDNEGNGFHELVFLFTDDKEFIEDIIDEVYDTSETNPDKIVILG